MPYRICEAVQKPIDAEVGEQHAVLCTEARGEDVAA